MRRRIGIYSGTFDPVHQGHIAFCQEAIQTCELDEVLLLPERNPRGKAGATDIVHREALLHYATAPFPALRVVILQSGQFTVAETLPELKRLLPGSELTLLVGSDVVRTFLYRWDNLAQLLSEVSLAIGVRKADTKEEIIEILRQVEQAQGVAVRYAFVETDHVTASSSQIRNDVEQAGWHSKMKRYMQQHSLYGV